MANPTIRFKRGTQSAFGSVGLQTGEPAFITDKFNLYIGVDGNSANNKFFGSSRYWNRENGSSAAQLRLVDKDGSNYIAIAASDTLVGVATYRFPNTDNGSTGDFLKVKSVSGGYYDLEWAAVPSGSFTIGGDIGGTDTFTTGETLTFEGGEGIDTTISNNKVTISAEAASTTNAGISSFTNSFYFINTYQVGIVTATTSTAGISYYNSADFDINGGGEVSLEDSVIKTVKVDGSTEVTPTNHILWVTGGEGIDVTTGIGGSISISGEDASDTNKGIASFDNGDFSVASGNVTLADSATGAVLTINGTASEVNVSRTNGTVTVGLPDDIIVGAALTVTGTLKVGTGVGVTQFSSSVSTGSSTSSVPTSQAVIDYVDTELLTVDLTIDTAGGTNGSGTGSVSTSQTLTFNGTTNEVDVSVSGQSVTYGLSDNVVVGTSLSSPTIRTNIIKSSDTNATAITITDNDVTIAGDLFVNGSTTQVNTTTLTVEDNLIELAKVDGSAPGSDVNKDVGLLMHYYDTAARLSAVYWDDSVSRLVMASRVSESSGVLTVESGYYADVEFKGLYITDSAGTSEEVISYATLNGVTGRHLQNIIVDGGVF